MKIKGFMKLTLLDYPTKIACTLFTAGCNFRCPFCHNGSLVLSERSKGEEISQYEIFKTLERRKGMLEGVCITGGEPTLQPDLAEFIKRIKDMGYLVKLDTNGYAPDKLRELLELGLLDYVAMDIKNTPEKYAQTVGIEKENFDIEKIHKSVDILKSSSIDHEFRTTVVKGLHLPEDFEIIGRWLGKNEKYFLQAFVKSDDLIVDADGSMGLEQMQICLEYARKYAPKTQLRGV